MIKLDETPGPDEVLAPIENIPVAEDLEPGEVVDGLVPFLHLLTPPPESAAKAAVFSDGPIGKPFPVTFVGHNTVDHDNATELEQVLDFTGSAGEESRSAIVRQVIKVVRDGKVIYSGAEWPDPYPISMKGSQ